MTPSDVGFGRFFLRMTACHTVTYMVVGFAAFTIMDYSTQFSAECSIMKPTDSPIVALGPHGIPSWRPGRDVDPWSVGGENLLDALRPDDTGTLVLSVRLPGQRRGTCRQLSRDPFLPVLRYSRYSRQERRHPRFETSFRNTMTRCSMEPRKTRLWDSRFFSPTSTATDSATSLLAHPMPTPGSRRRSTMPESPTSTSVGQRSIREST